MRSGDFGPGLPIPLSPRSGTSAWFRARVIGLRRPVFSAAHRVTILWISVTAALLAGQLIVITELRPWIHAAVAALSVYMTIRVISIAVYERDQHRFEQRWLTDQSTRLAAHAFEVIRCTAVRGPNQPTELTFDLSDAGAVADLLLRQSSEPTAVVRFEFVRWSPESPDGAIEHVRRELRHVSIALVQGELVRARIRFPQARYVAQPPHLSRDFGRPSTMTFWLLPGPVDLTIPTSNSVGSGTESPSRFTRGGS